MPREYAYYKGDEFIGLGTAEELSKITGVKPRTIEFYSTPTYKKRSKNKFGNTITVIKLEEDEQALICPCCKKPFYRSDIDEE